MDAKVSEWRPGPNVCRCCFTEGCYKDISTEYFWMGKREVYAEMLSETFDLTIAYSKSGGPNSNSRLICENCIARLRDATDFKRQVKECEKTFIQHLDPGNNITTEIELRLEADHDKTVKLESVKLEKRHSDDDFDDRNDFATTLDDDDDDLDDQPLLKLASKTPKKETENVDILDLLDNAKVTEKRKSSTKSKEPPTKKLKKKEPLPKPSASKSLTTEKKKKGPNELKWKRKCRFQEDKANAAIIIECTNVTPFRWKRGRFLCAYCPFVCPNPTDVRTHSAEHERRLDVLTRGDVRNTFPVRVEISDLKCRLCQQKIENLDALKDHLINKHSKPLNPKYADGIIPFVLSDKTFKCVCCDKQFEVFVSLSNHMNGHYPSYICDSCGKGFAAKHKLRTHKITHDTGEYPCSKCDLVFTTRAFRNRHMVVAHGPKNRYRCPHCGLTFGKYSDRIRHMAKVHGKKLEYRCTICTSVFGTCNLRTMHIKLVHARRRDS